MNVECKLQDYDNDKDELIVQSDMGLTTVKLIFHGETIKIDGYQLKKAIDNCMNNIWGY